MIHAAAGPALPAVATVLLCCCHLLLTSSADGVDVSDGGCNFPMVQQQFSLADTGLDGCHRLDSVARIFGEAASPAAATASAASSSYADRFTATRFAAANLVFLGRVVSGRDEEAAASASPVAVAAEVECVLKGRLARGGVVGSRRPVVRLVGFEQSLEGALCRGVRARTGDRAVFFATAVAAAGDAAPDVVVRVNENGVELDVNRTLAALGCRENRGLVEDDCGSRRGQGLQPPWMSTGCRVSVSVAMQLLERMRQHGSSGLRPECRGAPLHREAFEYASKCGASAVGPGALSLAHLLVGVCLSFATLATRSSAIA